MPDAEKERNFHYQKTEFTRRELRKQRSTEKKAEPEFQSRAETAASRYFPQPTKTSSQLLEGIESALAERIVWNDVIEKAKLGQIIDGGIIVGLNEIASLAENEALKGQISPEQLAEIKRKRDVIESVVGFHNQYLNFESLLDQSVSDVIKVFPSTEAQTDYFTPHHLKNQFQLFRPKDSPTSPVGEVFRQLENKGEAIATGAPEVNSIKSEIIEKIKNDYNLSDDQAQAVMAVGERLWRFFLRSDVFDQNLVKEDHRNSKRLFYPETWASQPKNSVLSWQVLLRKDLTGRPLADFGVRDFFSYQIMRGSSSLREALGNPEKFEPSFYNKHLDAERQQFKLDKVQLENLDWESLFPKEAIKTFWVDMKDADETRTALVGDNGILKPDRLDTDSIDSLRTKLANQKERRPFYIAALKEEASAGVFKELYESNRDIETGNQLEEYVEGLASTGAKTKNLAVESLWQRYFEDTGLTYQIGHRIVDKNRNYTLPAFSIAEGIGYKKMLPLDAWESVKSGTFNLSPEAVARLLLHIQDRDVIEALFPTRSGRSCYQTIKYFAGVVELETEACDLLGNKLTNPDGTPRLVRVLKPIELLEKEDLNYLIDEDRENLGEVAISQLSQIDEIEEKNRFGRPKRMVLDVTKKYKLSDSEVGVSRADIVEDFWKRMWGEHLDERQNVIDRFRALNLTVTSLRDLYANVFEAPIRRKLGFYNVPSHKRLLGVVGSILPLMERLNPAFKPGANFAYDRQTGTYYNFWDANRELFRRLKNLKYHMGPRAGVEQVAGQFIVAREAPVGWDTETAKRYGLRPANSSADYVLDRSNSRFDTQQLDPVYSFLLGDGLDRLDAKTRHQPIFWDFNNVKWIERSLLEKQTDFLAPQEGEWWKSVYEPGDNAKFVEIMAGQVIKTRSENVEVPPRLQLTDEQRDEIKRRIGATHLDRFFYQAKKLFWGIADERAGKTEPEVVTGFKTALDVLVGRLGLIGKTLARTPMIPTDAPTVLWGTVGIGAANAAGLDPWVGFLIGSGLSKGLGEFCYRNFPAGWMRAGARNLWRLKKYPWPIRLAASLSAHDYSGPDIENQALDKTKELIKFKS